MKSKPPKFGGFSDAQNAAQIKNPLHTSERVCELPRFSRLVAVQCDSISTTPSSPSTSQRQRTGVSALHKPVLRTLHQSTLYRITEFRIRVSAVEFTLAQSFRKTAASVSIARWLAWPEACGSPPTLRTNSSLLTCRASSTFLPLTNSVMADPQAIAGTQPLARKRTSAMRLPSNLRV